MISYFDSINRSTYSFGDQRGGMFIQQTWKERRGWCVAPSGPQAGISICKADQRPANRTVQLYKIQCVCSYSPATL